jgi:hypothetical protein
MTPPPRSALRGPAGLHRADRGTVSLVALCFVTVLAISLASYITLSSRAMQLSNRSFQAGVSKQLAEAGLEEILRAFNQNNWDDWTGGGISVDWTLDTSTKRATATMTFPAGKFGQGTTATVKLRVDNYDAAVVGVSWTSAKNYEPGDVVERSGLWYRCLQAHNNAAPNGDLSHHWVPDFVPSTWDVNISYSPQDMVFHNGFWYRCSNANTGSAPPGANWVRVSVVNRNSTAGVSGVQDAVVNWFGTWYRWNSGGWDAAPPISWRWRNTGLSYSYNDLVSYNNTWYRYISNTPTNPGPSYNNPGSDTSRWAPATNMWQWNSGGISYYSRDAVFYSGQWFRCIRAHTSSTSILPTNPAYWSRTPLFSPDWTPARRYAQFDTARYNGIWYLSLQNNNTGENPETDTDTSHWIAATTANPAYVWNSTTNHAVGAYRCYGGAWYRCIKAGNTGRSPNDSEFWTASWSNSWGVTTGAPVAYAESAVSVTGNPPIRTQLRATLAPTPLFPNAAGATGDLTITTGSGVVDSYDSQLAPYNAGTAGYSATLAAGGTLAINGTTAVQGYLAWPFGPAPSGISTATTVKGPASPASPNLDRSRLSRNPNVPAPDTQPAGSLAAAWSSIRLGLNYPDPTGSDQTLNLGSPGSSIPSVYSVSGNLELQGSQNSRFRTLNINGPVILYVNGNFRPRGGGVININGPGSLELHYARQLTFDNGTVGLNNRAPTAGNPDPRRLLLIGHTETNDVQYLRNFSRFDGLVYVPYANVAAGLEISGSPAIYGAVSAKNLTFNSAATLHYDTTLRYATIPGVDQPWAVADWRELPATERAILP